MDTNRRTARIAGLLMLDCLAVLVWVFQFFFLPGSPAISYVPWAVSFVAEVALTLWLIVQGVADRDAGSLPQLAPTSAAN